MKDTDNSSKRGELSERELLMLSNFMYLDSSTEQATINEILNHYKSGDGTFIREAVEDIPTSGGITTDEVVNLFRMMDEADEDFKSLRVEKSIDEGGIRGSCFVSGDGDATVVFRGTGGTYDAWNDNVLGEFKSDTAMQIEAAIFIEEECAGYDNITVSGHSKGGNLAQYVTVMCDEKVDRCVSFDGQGFSGAFIAKNKETIEGASAKIKSISAHNDFVNILLVPIASERVFVKNDKSGVNAHSSYYLLTDNTFNEYGDFTSIISQSPIMAGAEKSVLRTVELIDCLPDGGNAAISGLLGAITAGVMSSDRSLSYELGRIFDGGNKVLNYAGRCFHGKGLMGDVALVNYYSNEISFPDFMSGLNELKNCSAMIRTRAEEVEDIHLRLNYSISTRTYTNQTLRSTEEGLRDIAERLSGYVKCGEEIVELYSESEKKNICYDYLKA